MQDKEIADQDADEVSNPSELTSWEKEPTVAQLKQDYSDAQSDHSIHVTNVSNWLDNMNVTGSAKIKPKKGRSSIVPKVIRKQAEWRYTALSEPFLSTDDVFNVSPITAEDKLSAEQNSIVLNNQFNNQIDKVTFIDEYVRTAVDEGTVILQTGWEFIEETFEVEVPAYSYKADSSPEASAMIRQAMQQRMIDPQGFMENTPPQIIEAVALSEERGEIIRPYRDGTTTETQTRVIKDQPTVKVCDYKSTIVDPTCGGDIDAASFVITTFDTSLSELKRDGRYKNLDKIQVDNNAVHNIADSSGSDVSSFNFSDAPRKKFVAYEYWGFWDIDGTGIVKPIVATWVGDVMIRLEENPFPDGKLPFIIVQYLPVRKEIHGEPDGHLIEDNQKIIGAVTRGMIDVLARSAYGQVGTMKGALDVTNKRRMEAGDHFEYNNVGSPGTAFHMNNFPELPASTINMINMQNVEAESMTGIKAYNQGITGNSLGDTTGNANSALSAAAKRELGIVRRLANGIIKVGRKFISMNAEFLSESQIVRVTNDEFVEVRRDDLEGNIDLRLTISTAEADDQKAKELSFMLQTMGNNMDPGTSKMILVDIAKLRKMPDLAKKLEEYEPQPDPMAVRKAELEIALLEAQIREVESKTIENHANAQLDSAKAREVSATADVKDLDYVERESGVTQARELEKQSAQAKANAGLEFVKHQLKQQEGANQES